MEKAFKNCQSCGMPLSRDEKGGGSERDGRPVFLRETFTSSSGGANNPKGRLTS